MTGTFLGAEDIDGDSAEDLLIGCPFAQAPAFETGKLCVFLSSKNRHRGEVLHLDKNADWCTHGHSPFEWFGYHAVVAATNTSRILIVGAPYFNNGTDAFGRLYGFDLKNFSSTTDEGSRNVPLKWSIFGDDPKGKLGFSFDFGQPVPGRFLLALSIPTATIMPEHFWEEEKSQAGVVVLLSIDNLVGNYTIGQLPLFAKFQSSEVSFCFSRSHHPTGVFSPWVGNQISQAKKWTFRFIDQ